MFRKVTFYTTSDGKCPVAEFIDSQPAKVAQKIAWVLKAVQEIQLCKERMNDFLKREKKMENKTFDLDDYIFARKEKDSDFAKDFDAGYEDFKIEMMIKEMRHENRIPQEQLRVAML
jgi:hypothetical protein